jgi:hypothetical protein
MRDGTSLHPRTGLYGISEPCSTGIALRCEKIIQNVTLVVDEDLLLAARKVALDRRTSVNQLVREYLAALVEEPSRRRLARARLKRAFETGLVDVGDRTWSRNDLYDR